jgi:ABC-type branched-subunit amino acid transport system permease subunit
MTTENINEPYAYRSKLPFVKYEGGTRIVWWNVTPTGKWASDFKVGRQYAQKFWEVCGSGRAFALEFQQVVLGMLTASKGYKGRSYSGIEAGFLLAVGELSGGVINIDRVVSSPFGYVLRALGTNALRVQYLGIDVRAHRLAAFVLSGAFAGLAGAIFALSNGNVFPGWLNWTASAAPVVMAVLGGTASFLGPALGAAVYVVLEVLISGRTEYWSLAMGVIIVILVLLMPEGLTGVWRKGIVRGGARAARLPTRETR